MPHARHRLPRQRSAPRTVLPAVLLTIAGTAFAGMAALPSAAEPAGPDVLAFTAAAEPVPEALAPPERTFDLSRASRDRQLVAQAKRKPAVVAPKPAPPKPAAAKPSPKPKPKASPVAKRLRRTTTAKVFGGRCPVPSASFTDTWGAPRSGGRSHKGTDLMADIGDPVYAVASGVVDTTYSSNGGYSLYLQAANGDRYFYAHNSQNVASDGERVSAGQLIARVGNTGNARYTGAHVHFEREIDGRSVNPYRFLRALCG